MFLFFVKRTFRSYYHNRLIFFGSLLTSILGALCITLLLLNLVNEYSTDKFHKHWEKIYAMTVQSSNQSQPELSSPSIFLGFDYTKHPEIEALTHIAKYSRDEVRLIHNQATHLCNTLVADSLFFKVFDFKLLAGNRNDILSDPLSVILTESFARVVFGEQNPIGQSITVIIDSELHYTVNGILKDIPTSSSIHFDMLLPSHSSDFSISGADFFMANSQFDSEYFDSKIVDIGADHFQFKESKISHTSFSSLYFNKNIGRKNIFTRSGNKENLSVLIAIIFVAFLVTVLNLMNLQVLYANSQLKSLGVNRVAGAKWAHIFWQRLVESAIFVLIAALVTSVVSFMALPYFNQIIGIDLSPKFFYVFLLILCVLLTSFMLALIYPNVLLYRVTRYVAIQKNLLSKNYLNSQKWILSLQFIVMIILLVSTIVMSNQLRMMLDKDLGFKSKNIIKTQFFRYESPASSREEHIKQQREKRSTFDFIINELEGSSFVTEYARGTSPLGAMAMPWRVQGEDFNYTSCKTLTVTPSYATLFDLVLVDGRFFDAQIDKSREPKVVINQAAQRLWGIEEISTVNLWNQYWSIRNGYQIIGVVKDFHFDHLANTVQPLVMIFFDDLDLDFLIRFNDGLQGEGFQFVKNLHQKVTNAEPFVYTFIENELSGLYKQENQLLQVYSAFTIFSMLIITIGLFTVSLYEVNARTKEIGIRKVNGAKIWQVMLMLNMDFVKWVAIAFVIATPIAYFAMDKWLQNFAYRTQLSWWVFALAGLMALVIALLTVSWQSWLAARRNPVEALRYE
jgi:putative ABC transport system permease protein